MSMSVAAGYIIESHQKKEVTTAYNVDMVVKTEFVTQTSGVLNNLSQPIITLSADNTQLTQDETTKYPKQYQSVMASKGIIVADDEEKLIKTYKRENKKSKTLGYVINNSVIQVIEKNDTWCKVKSGKIAGYIKSKYVVTEEVAEKTIIDNGMLWATVTAEKSVLTDNSKNDDKAIGVGYKGKTYEVLGFSNNYKKVRIQRTEDISGWIKTKEVSFSIDAPGIMTKDEAEKYIEIQQAKREAEYAKAATYVGKTGGTLVDIIMSMVAHNESGNYTAARNALPQFKGEKTITVGAWQWYGERAHKLLRKIVMSDESEAKDNILDIFSGSKKKKKEKMEKLCNDILSYDNWERDGRKFTNEEILAVKELLGTKKGIQIQNEQARSDIQVRINIAKNTYKITNARVIAYFVDLYWQSPEHALSIIKETLKQFDSVKDLNSDGDAVDYIHAAAMKDKVMNKFSERRKYTYAVSSKIKMSISTGSSSTDETEDEDTDVKMEEISESKKKKTDKESSNNKETNKYDNVAETTVNSEQKEEQKAYETEAEVTTEEMKSVDQAEKTEETNKVEEIETVTRDE